MAEPHPQVHVLAGPNGAGKTTFARTFLPSYAAITHFVNADLIAGGLSPFAPEREAIRAGRLMLDEIHRLAERRVDFAFETTLAGRSYEALLREFKQQGYALYLYFLWLPDVQLALERIADRVRRGGHNVPEDDVRRRFHRGTRNFVYVYCPLADNWILFDNSGASPRQIALVREGALTIVEEGAYRRFLEAAGPP
jgi:predicted ABC-type ATPase